MSNPTRAGFTGSFMQDRSVAWFLLLLTAMKKSASALAKSAPNKRRQKEPLSPAEIFRGDYKFYPHEDPHRQRLKTIRDSFKVPNEGTDEGRSIRTVLYAGSWIHVTPSLVFPEVIYVDSFTGRKNLIRTFFENSDLGQYIEEHKRYEDDGDKEKPASTESDVHIQLVQQDYHAKLPASVTKKFPKADLLISLDAGGDISTSCAAYIHKGGYLYVNDGHGDACTAFGNPNLWELCGCFPEDDGELLTSHDDLDRFFVHAKKREKGRRLTQEEALLNSGCGFSKRPHKCRENATVFIFRKV